MVFWVGEQHYKIKNSKCTHSKLNSHFFGSGCGSVGRAVASNTSQLCIEKTKIKKKEAGNGLF